MKHKDDAPADACRHPQAAWSAASACHACMACEACVGYHRAVVEGEL